MKKDNFHVYTFYTIIMYIQHEYLNLVDGKKIYTNLTTHLRQLKNIERECFGMCLLKINKD